jgi:hypothetical protein
MHFVLYLDHDHRAGENVHSLLFVLSSLMTTGAVHRTLRYRFPKALRAESRPRVTVATPKSVIRAWPVSSTRISGWTRVSTIVKRTYFNRVLLQDYHELCCGSGESEDLQRHQIAGDGSQGVIKHENRGTCKTESVCTGAFLDVSPQFTPGYPF